MFIPRFSWFYITYVRAGVVRVGVANSKKATQQGMGARAVVLRIRTFNHKLANTWIKFADQILFNDKTSISNEYAYNPRSIARISVQLRKRHVSNTRLAAWLLFMLIAVAGLSFFFPVLALLTGWKNAIDKLLRKAIIPMPGYSHLSATKKNV